MSCLISTSPINITNSPTGTCELKCNYKYKYNDSNTTIKNNNNYISLSYEKPNIDPVIYNSLSYYVEQIRLYFPSLHTYNGVKADGEMIIIHRSDYREKLLVCIPIIIKGNTLTELDNIVSLVEKYANQPGKSTYSTKTINLNTYIPNKPMYIYKGSLPFDECTGIHNIIVFSKKDDAYIQMSELSNIKIIKPYTIKVKSAPFYVNKKGPVSSLIETSDDIYIDCNPIGDNGEVIGELDVDDNKRQVDLPIEAFLKKVNLKRLINSQLFQVILGILIAFITYKLFTFMLNLITSISVKKISSPTIIRK